MADNGVMASQGTAAISSLKVALYTCKRMISVQGFNAAVAIHTSGVIFYATLIRVHNPSNGKNANPKQHKNRSEYHGRIHGISVEQGAFPFIKRLQDWLKSL